MTKGEWIIRASDQWRSPGLFIAFQFRMEMRVGRRHGAAALFRQSWERFVFPDLCPLKIGGGLERKGQALEGA